jgi:hypothetical protein
MRYREFELTEDELFELNMSPTNLKKMAGDIDARAGMEFELIVPGVESGDEDDYDVEPDYDMDESFPTGRGWRTEVINFFMGGDYGSGRSTIQRELDRLDEAYWEWKGNQFDDWLSNNDDVLFNTVRGQMTQQDDESDEQFAQRVRDTIADGGDEYDAAMEEMQEEYDQEDMWDEFLSDEGISTMSDFGNRNNLDWPYVTETGGGGGGGADIDTIADDFSQAIGRPVNAASRYHGATREPGKYVVEPDGSLQGDDGETGLEFVSPPLTIPEMLEDLDRVAKWANRVGAYTNDSTGLHINVSVPNQQNLDYVKLAMFLGDEYILKQFGREGNTYCKSALNKIKQQAKQNPDQVKEMMRQFQGGLNQLASKMIHTGSTEKFTSINNRDGWIEFRSPGGDWLGEYATGENKVTNTLLRAVVALDVATKPEEYKQEYYKKLYKTLSQGESDDTIQFFAKYAAGELPQSALKAFVKNAQLQRQRGKEEKQQIDTLHKELGGVSQEQLPPVDFDGNYEVYKIESGNAIYRFRANNTQEAYNMLQRWRTSIMQPGLDPREFNVRAVARQSATAQQTYQVSWTINDGTSTTMENVRVQAPNANSAMQQVRDELAQQGLTPESINADLVAAPAATEPVPGSTVDLARQRAAQQQPAQGTSSLPPGNARWLVLDREDREVYSFVNTTAQSDANQYARDWMINRAPREVRDRGPFTIVPAR